MDNFDFLCTYGFTCLRKAFFDVEKYRKFVLQFVLQDQDQEQGDAEVCPHVGGGTSYRVNMILSVLQLHGLLCQENWFVDLTPSSRNRIRKPQKNNAVTDEEVVVEATTDRLERYRSVFSPALFTLFFLNAQYCQLCSHQIINRAVQDVEAGGASVLPTLQHSPDSATLSSSTSKGTTSKKRKNYTTTHGTAQQLLHGKKRQENRSSISGTTTKNPSFPCRGGGVAQVPELDLESQLEIAYELAAGSSTSSRFNSRSTGAGATTSSSTTLLEDFNFLPTSTPISCLEKMVEDQAKKLIQKLLRDEYEYDYEEDQVLVRDIENKEISYVKTSPP